jgi:hypothetical protein
MLHATELVMIKYFLELILKRMLQTRTTISNLTNENVYSWIHIVHENALTIRERRLLKKEPNKHMIGMLEDGFQVFANALFNKNREVYNMLVALKDDCIAMLKETTDWYTNPDNCSQPLSDVLEKYASEEDYHLIFDGVKKSREDFNKSIKDTKFLLHPDKNQNEPEYVRKRREQHFTMLDDVKNEIRLQCLDWWNRENISM